MGDFNTFNGVKELKELLKETHLKDMIKLDTKSKPFTEPAWKPERRLDYILTSPQLRVKKYSVLHFHFSDHLPLMIDFEFRKGKTKVALRKTPRAKIRKRKNKKNLRIK
jgi:endonuclease/exonuclease/phosphatase family metal-dependent hydrolase